MDRHLFSILPLNPYPALLLKSKKEKILVIADLHIGWEVSLAEEGIHIPSQTHKLLSMLEEIIRNYQPDSLVILGDVKHTVARIEIEEWRDVPNFFESLLKRISNIKVILGNHDGNLEPLLPEDVEIVGPRGLVLENVGLFHGHTWPRLEIVGCETGVLGHLHPTVSFRDQAGYRITKRVWVRARCDGLKLTNLIMKRTGFKTRSDPFKFLKEHYGIGIKISHIVVMPSFNEFLGGQSVNTLRVGKEKKFSEFIGPVLRSECVDLERAETYLLDGTFLGRVEQLRMLS